MTCVKGAINMTLRFHTKMVGVVSCAEGWRRKKLSHSLKDGRTVTGMDDYDYCGECQLYGDDYSYDKDGDLVSNCDGCSMHPDMEQAER